MKVSPVLMQSEKVTIVAGGEIDLGTEALRFNFNTRPRTGVGISAGMFTNPFIELAGTLASPRLGMGAKGATSGAAAAATGGVSVLAQGFLDRARGGQDLCKMTLDTGRREGEVNPRMLAALAAAILCAAPVGAQDKAAAPAKPRQLSLQNKPWTGDFDQMLERRVIRVLAPYSRTLYYVDKARERGITAELVREFERYVNKRYAKQLGNRPLTVFLIPTTRERLLPGLAEGQGDIAAGNLTATEERLKLVDFAAPADRKPVRELIVTGPASPALATLDDLSGKTVHVRKASSYYESVAALNERLKKERKAPVKVVELPNALEDEDALEMLAAGLFELAVVDDWKALLWAQILPKIKVREDLVLRAEGHTGWAIRKDSPKLAGVLNDFYRGVLKKQRLIESRLAAEREARQAHPQQHRRRGMEALRGDRAPVREIRREVPLRSR